jgi:peptidoglycan/LPS O-acetylase OafA/YrhL
MQIHSKQHIKALTGMRFFAAFLVLLMHFSDYVKLPDIFLPIIKAGGIGVSFFFVLSGFLLYIRYGQIFENQILKKDILNFYKSRIFRIYPAYFLGLLIVTIIHCTASAILEANPLQNISTFSWIINLFALQTFSPSIITQQFWNAPSWSVSTEFFFYFIFPFFLYFFTKHIQSGYNLILAIVLFLAMWVLLRTIVVFGAFAGWFDKLFWVDYLSDRNFFWRFWEFGIGVLVGKLLITNQFNFLRSKINRNIIILTSIAIIFVIAYMPWPLGEMSQLLARVMRLAILNTIPFAIIIAVCCSGENFLSKALENKLTLYLGECSFAIYIYHWSFWLSLEYTQKMGAIITPPMVLFCIFGTIIFSMASYSFYENPLKNWATKKFIR